MRPARLLLPALLAAALVTGCSGTVAPPAPDTAPAAAVALPWPARSAAEATGLQQAADSGAQPWLLDPEETARSYVAAAYGWSSATTEVTGAHTVAVTGPDGTRRALTLVQPDRAGPGGIWSIAEDAGPAEA